MLAIRQKGRYRLPRSLLPPCWSKLWPAWHKPERLERLHTFCVQSVPFIDVVVCACFAHTGAMSSSYFVEVDQVSMRYGLEGDTLAQEACSLKVKPGEFVSVVGPSGCGKSTLMRLVTGFLLRH